MELSTNKQASFDFYDENKIVEEVETVLQLVDEEIYYYFKKILNNEDDGFIYFDRYYNLPDNKSCRTLMKNNLLVDFVFETFLQNDDEKLAFKSLKIIRFMIDDNITFDKKSYINENFISVLIQLFEHPFKDFAVLSQIVLYNIMTDNFKLLDILLKYDFFNKVFEVCNFKGVEVNVDISRACEEMTAYFGYIVVKQENIEKFGDILFQFTMRLFKSITFIDFLRSPFFLLFKINEHKYFEFKPDDFLIEKILFVAKEKGEGLNDMLRLVDSLKTNDDFIKCLYKNGFINNLLSDLKLDNYDITCVIRFFISLDIYPDFSTEHGKDMLNKLFELFMNSGFNCRVEAMIYIKEIIKSNERYIIHLLKYPIFDLILDYLETTNDVSIVLECLFYLSSALIAANYDLDKLKLSERISQRLTELEYHDDSNKEYIEIIRSNFNIL